ncbi:MAG TPA: hypothetical protein DEG17_01045 [Cyanobacteria bacterium UBA11149]|nr:hypothetical protein [Cyanobacteria bacterium UBA11367]HBE59072.1 hypothetical protein [Cyanobacteria bacterium UBA11366]HBK66599.1 hypothetical protein [Cyanobacteria bacterium UBA11166]HBR72752.1 hypothetical protein [Cyanobacteria bacterium UBA11159]HBS67929.1 hypothetical protein [Cyanobacteria bacterium UBA11153]HBW87500.1 hypothetical protein [Cyanobacteria bacterium UBA11149]HCA94038.1 hypothetical protein [Cyanobacteria bacterium UBA9226]
MSVVVIGDRQVGKTSMVVSLHNPGTKHVKVLTNLSKYYNLGTGEITFTRQKEEETLVINVDLPAGERQIQVRWIDTPGEVWEDKEWRNTHAEAWQDIRKEVSQSQGILLLLPPHRSMIQSHLLDGETTPDNFPRPDAWVNNLESWLQFFRQNCVRVPHILISIHKADLFCHPDAEEKNWRYNPSKNPLWFEYNNYIRRTYFSKADNIIREYNAQSNGTALRFFITTTKNLSLLEIPWVYLGAFIANDLGLRN